MQCIMIASSNISHDQSDRWCLLIALVQKDQFFVYYIGQLQNYNTVDSDSAQAIITCAPAAKVSLFLFVLFCVMATPAIPQCKRVRSSGCTVCGNAAKNKDPATGMWYCRVCFHDVRPDLTAMASGERPAGKYTNRIVGKTPLCNILRRGLCTQPAYTPRCFVCFSDGDDVTESACDLNQSAFCGIARLCAACRSMHVDVRCFSCWGETGACYKCKRKLPVQRASLECRLCHKCGVNTRELQCFFCKRNDISVAFELCSRSCGSDLVPICITCQDVNGDGKILCPSCFKQGWEGKCY